jgi:hypothetical protein
MGVAVGGVACEGEGKSLEAYRTFLPARGRDSRGVHSVATKERPVSRCDRIAESRGERSVRVRMDLREGVGSDRWRTVFFEPGYAKIRYCSVNGGASGNAFMNRILIRPSCRWAASGRKLKD